LTLGARKKIKRIIYTSSISTIRHSPIVESSGPVTKVYTENDWNEESVEIVQKLGKDADSHDKYQASKIFAERGKF
jgi:nucleoside-diphosphate-sugar epimerase